MLDEIRRAAFYSRAAPLLEALYERWERSGRKGEPIDYATKEELEELNSILEWAMREPIWKLARSLGYTPGGAR